MTEQRIACIECGTTPDRIYVYSKYSMCSECIKRVYSIDVEAGHRNIVT